jgi:flagellar hook-associated protein 1 FlgK
MNLLAGLGTAADALGAFSQALQVTENNVVNASTPGYVRQTQTFEARQFDPETGATGGVEAGLVQSARDEFADQAVRAQTSLLGAASQNVSSLQSVETIFDISGTSGIPYALNNLFQSFSAWAQSPTNANARQSVIDNAATVAGAFNDVASGLNRQTFNTNQQIEATVAQVNQLVSELQQANVQEMNGHQNDSGLDSRIHASLEQLSQYANISASKTNGAWTVLLGGQTPLLVGSKQFQISAALETPPDAADPHVPPQAVVRAADGTDITSTITTGQLGALLHFRNTVLASYIGSGNAPGELNILAQQFADCVNSRLTSGNISDGPPAQPGVALFTYDDSHATNVARSLAVNPAITAAQLAPIDPGPPKVSNGVPLALAQLASPHSDADEIGGQSYSQYYGSMAAGIGTLLAKATNEEQVQQSAVAQAQNLRQQASGVDLNEEAMKLTQFQRAYEAVSRMVSVLAQITEDAVNIMSA